MAASSRPALLYTYCVINQVNDEKITLPNSMGFGAPHLTIFRDVAAVVSEVPASQFSQQVIDRRTQDPRWLAEAATKHEKVVEQIMHKVTPIPMKLCTIFTGRERVVEMLKQNYTKFKTTLKRIEGRVELGVTAYCDLNNPKIELVETNSRIKTLHNEITTATPGRAYFLKQELEDLTVTEARRRAQALGRAIFQQMRECSDDGVLNKPLSREATQDKNEMILNAAYLVRKDKVNSFKARFQEAVRHYSKVGVELKLTGPWPPYNFC